MKLLILLILTTVTASADWGPVPLKSLVEHSNCIVIAGFVSEESKSGSPERTEQKATLKVISIIKGEAPETIFVNGYVDTRLCKAQFVFPADEDTRYLLFLGKNNDTYSVINGMYGALTITDEKVMWFTDDTMVERKPIELDTAINAIRAADIELAKSMSPEKAVEVLINETSFGFGAKKGAPEPKSDIAIRIIISDAKAKEHCQTVFEKGSTASKLFALCAIRKLDPANFEKLSKSLKQDEVIGTHFGCVVGDSKVSEIIHEIAKGSYDPYFMPDKSK